MYFWISDNFERERLYDFVMNMEAGKLSALDIPCRMTCLINLCGEQVQFNYNSCSEIWTDNPFMFTDMSIEDDTISLGEGECLSSTPMSIPLIISRMRELEMLVPAGLLKMAGDNNAAN